MITVSTILQQLLIAVPTIIVSTTLITGLINGALNISNGNIKHLISWIVAVVCGMVTVLTGDVTFGYGYIDYAIGACFGLLAGGASNGLYDWSAIANLVDKFYSMFGNGNTIEEKRSSKKNKDEKENCDKQTSEN